MQAEKARGVLHRVTLEGCTYLGFEPENGGSSQ